jgi:hypothetical protein
MKRLLPLILLLAGCGDNVAGPGREASLSIEFEAQRLREATMLVGDSLPLSASLKVANRPSSIEGIRWNSTNEAVASVSATGVVRAEAVGAAQVIAVVGSAADTVNITVLGGGSGAADCTGAGLQLAVGESFVTTAAALPRLCLAGGEGGSEYLLVPFHAASGAQTLSVEIAGNGVNPISPPRLGLDVGHSHAPLFHLSGEPTIDSDFDRRLREREARELTPLIRGDQIIDTPRFSVSAATLPRVGDELTLNVNSKQTCTAPVNRRARVAAISDRAIVLADVDNPGGGFTAQDYIGFGKAFDDLVYPTITTNFGEPTDIDGNGRVMILFTRAVNEMTEVDSDSYVAGFFYGRDLFPRTDQPGLRGCAASNVAELLYMLVPDPNGTINGNRRSRDFVLERTVGVLAHELQHLINASRRLRIVRTQNWNEEFWLNEGLSHVAEELVFYAATPFGPRQNITIQGLRAQTGGIQAFNQYQVTNFGRLSSYLKRPEAFSPTNGTGLETRGAAWSFLRYAADRRGTPETGFWRRLIDADVVGYDNLMGALQASPLDWMHDWAVANFADDVVAAGASMTHPSWHFRSILPALSSNNGTFPLTTRDLRSGDANRLRLELVGGGSAFVRFAVPAEGRGEIATTSGGAPAPSRLRLRVVRTR